MGTTCTAAVLGPDHVSLAQIGDSRACLAPVAVTLVPRE